MPYIGTVINSTVADGAITFAKIQDQSANTVIVRNADSSGSLSALALATTQILIGDGTGFTAAALSGDVTMTNAGVVSLDNAQTNIQTVYSTSLKMGRDTENLIDFATTDNEIILRVNNVNEVKLAANVFSPVASDGAALGSTAFEWSDLYLADGAVIGFGADQDVTLTHVADAGLLLNTDKYITFRDSALKIYSSADGQLDIDADTEIEITATTIDIDGAIVASSTYTGGGLMTTGGNIVIPDAGSVGSASDTNAITISAAGVVAVTATTANTSATNGALTVAGGVGIAADLSVGDDVRLISDAAILNFGADNDVNLTHVADTGLLLNSTRQLQFGDSGTYIHQSADGVLALVSDTEIEITATTIDINGAIDIDKNINYSDTTPANAAYIGITGTFTAGEDLLAGEVVSVHTDGKVYQARAKAGNSDNGMIGAEQPAIGLVVADVDESVDAATTVLLHGSITHTSNFPTYTVGSTLYVPEDETSSKNVPEDAAPADDGDFVQVIGVALAAQTVFVNPDLTVIEVA